MFPLFHTLSNVESGDTRQLQQSTENSKGNLYVGLKSFNYTVGWYNIDSTENEIILWASGATATA